MIDTLHLAISERIKRFTGFCEKLRDSNQLYQQQMGDSASASLILQKDQLVNNRDQAGGLIRGCLDSIDSYENKAFLSIIRRQIDRVGPGYIDVIKSLDADEPRRGLAGFNRSLMR